MHHIGRNGGTLHVRRVPIIYTDCEAYVIEIHVVWCGCPFLIQHPELIGVMYDSCVWFSTCSELLAKERNELYWQFVTEWLQSDKGTKHQTDEECVQHIEERGSVLLGATLSPLFRLSLSLRSASPKVVLYQQLASESLSAYSRSKVLLHTLFAPHSTSVLLYFTTFAVCLMDGPLAISESLLSSNMQE